MNIQPPQHHKGLTLVETLVAISILLVAVVGPMTIYARSITDARYAGDRITASYLAQEAVEYLKQRVYTNMNAGKSWFFGFNSCKNQSNCKVDVFNNKICWNAGANCSEFLQLNASVAYDHGIGSIPTVFKRTVVLEEITANTEANVSATVSWTRAGTTKSVTITERIFKWR